MLEVAAGRIARRGLGEEVCPLLQPESNIQPLSRSDRGDGFDRLVNLVGRRRPARTKSY